MKLILQLPGLSLHRKMSHLSMLHSNFPNSRLKNELLSDPTCLLCRTNHCHKVDIPFCRTNLHSDYFMPKTAKEWNQLPTLVATILNVSAFESAVQDYFMY